MVRYFCFLTLVAIALLCNLGWCDVHVRAADVPGAQKDEKTQELNARLMKLEAEVRRLKTIVEMLQQQAPPNQTVLDETMVLGQWVGGPQSLVLSFERNNKFAITGNPLSGPVRGRGTWKLDENGQVVATYKYDGNPDWATTALPLKYTAVETLEFAGISYRRHASRDVPSHE